MVCASYMFLQIIQGVCQADEQEVVNADTCAQLLAHETCRVLHDRLVCQEDKILFYDMLADTLHDYFKVRKYIE